MQFLIDEGVSSIQFPIQRIITKAGSNGCCFGRDVRTILLVELIQIVRGLGSRTLQDQQSICTYSYLELWLKSFCDSISHQVFRVGDNFCQSQIIHSSHFPSGHFHDCIIYFFQRSLWFEMAAIQLDIKCISDLLDTILYQRLKLKPDSMIESNKNMKVGITLDERNQLIGGLKSEYFELFGYYDDG